jgi:hypothetical protein
MTPLLLAPESKYYKKHAERGLKKGIMRSEVGSMVFSTFQPPAIELRNGPRPQNNIEASTTVRIDLRFEAVCEKELPPGIVSSEVKIKAMKFFGKDPWYNFPGQSGLAAWGPRQTYWSETVSLCSNDRLINWN